MLRLKISVYFIFLFRFFTLNEEIFFSILYLTSIEIIFTIYNFIYIVLITFAIETN